MHRHGLSLGDFRLYSRVLFPIVASVLYSQDCETHVDTLTTLDAPAPYSAHAEAFERTPSASLLSRAWKYMLCVDYGVPGVKPVNAIGPVRNLDGDLFAFAGSVVNVATHFCHYWINMSKRQRVKFWHCIAGSKRQIDSSDYGMMLYRLHIHHERHYHNAYLGYGLNYTGALPALVDSIPSKGLEGLIRKLSVDYHVMVPALHSDSPREACQMNRSIRNLADKYGISLTVPTDKMVVRVDHDSEQKKNGCRWSHIAKSIRLALLFGKRKTYG
ncbi:hypothetical protein PG994_014000 [Apiospora phragmitis]|uniref:Uncharacterized protein n=1 Tax=Apiospora phragmitis TaxID=2905665 RepID=A0ABR1T332_9PEZI